MDFAQQLQVMQRDVIDQLKQYRERTDTQLHHFRQELNRPGPLSREPSGKSLASLLWEKEVISSTGVGSATPGVLVGDRSPGVYAPPTRRLRIRDLIPSMPTSGPSVEYIREETFVNRASPQTETISKGESAVTFSIANAPSEKSNDPNRPMESRGIGALVAACSTARTGTRISASRACATSWHRGGAERSNLRL